MKIILLEDVKKLGKRGDIVEVADGYARNFLFPRGMAEEATKGGIKQIQHEKKVLKKQQQKEMEEAKVLAEKISELKVEIKAKSGSQGKLFGSITSKDIADALEKQHKIKIDRRKIELKEPIKALGNYEIVLKLMPEVVAKFFVNVVEG